MDARCPRARRVQAESGNLSVATVPPYTHYTPEQLIACKGP